MSKADISQKVGRHCWQPTKTRFLMTVMAPTAITGTYDRIVTRTRTVDWVVHDGIMA